VTEQRPQENAAISSGAGSKRTGEAISMFEGCLLALLGTAKIPIACPRCHFVDPNPLPDESYPAFDPSDRLQLPTLLRAHKPNMVPLVRESFS
jgi:hypothetical protein